MKGKTTQTLILDKTNTAVQFLTVNHVRLMKHAGTLKRRWIIERFSSELPLVVFI